MPADTQAIEYSGELTSSYLVAYMIRRLPLDEMLAAIQQCNTLGPILDPTAWNQRAGKMREDESVLRILATAKRELDRIMPPAPPKASGPPSPNRSRGF